MRNVATPENNLSYWWHRDGSLARHLFWLESALQLLDGFRGQRLERGELRREHEVVGGGHGQVGEDLFQAGRRGNAGQGGILQQGLAPEHLTRQRTLEARTSGGSDVLWCSSIGNTALERKSENVIISLLRRRGTIHDGGGFYPQKIEVTRFQKITLRDVTL